MKQSFFIISLLITFLSCRSQDSTILRFNLGDTAVTIKKTCFNNCTSKVLFLNLHDDEKTSVEAAEEYLSESGGTLVNVHNNGQRNISFGFNQNIYTFDPNRIYNAAGVEATVKLLTKNYDSIPGAHISGFASQLLSNFVDSSVLIVTLHNNKESGLSVQSYLQEQQSKKHFGNVYVSRDMDVDDFILTTDSTIYNRIKNKNINVIYEKTESVKDDGSLSIYSGRLGIPYINIEAQHGHFIEQLAMLYAIDDIIKEYAIRQPIPPNNTAKK